LTRGMQLPAAAMAALLGLSEEGLLEETDRLGIPHDGSYRYDPELVALWFDEQELWMGHA
jgi:hypothetical protein